jgi:hypothetical protein
MSIRTTETTVTFKHPFNLQAFDGAFPPGIYRLVIDDEEIAGLSFLAYRRSAVEGKHQVFPTDDRELESALRADAYE